MSAVAERYPTLAAVAAVDAGGAKRTRVLRAIAAYLDEGHAPSLREVADRAELKDWRQAQQLIVRLEQDGLLEVAWARRGWRRGEKAPRNSYAILLPERAAA